ncbi:three-Cys-motif partner protein TcmP [Thermodesulfobacteriota bacterium]
MTKKFFDEAKEQSIVKATIVTKYFWAWANVMLSQSHVEKIAYFDLFAGPGRYKDGTKSTPMMLLEKAINDPKICDALVTLFNDKNTDSTASLQKDIESLKGIKKLKYKPEIMNGEVGTEIVKKFEKMELIPTLMFIDPWGYKGLSLRLINSVLKDWGCECIFFFNYNRINMGLTNPLVQEHMAALFGEGRARELESELKDLDSFDRELYVVEALVEALHDLGGEYVIPFLFKNSTGKRTSHHLFFVSKHPLGYGIMKTIMAKESSFTEQGVPSFEYNPATSALPRLFEYSRPLDELAVMLLDEFSGQTLTMKNIYERHNVGRRFIKKNYKDVLSQLEKDSKIKADPPMSKRRVIKGELTFADRVEVTFP